MGSMEYVLKIFSTVLEKKHQEHDYYYCSNSAIGMFNYYFSSTVHDHCERITIPWTLQCCVIRYFTPNALTVHWCIYRFEKSRIKEKIHICNVFHTVVLIECMETQYIKLPVFFFFLRLHMFICVNITMGAFFDYLFLFLCFFFFCLERFALPSPM